MGPPRSTSNAYPLPSTALTVRDMPARMRPREEIDRVGVQNVADDVLLAVLLRSGAKGLNVIELARHLLRTYGSLTELAKRRSEELAEIRGMGPVKAQALLASLELARRLAEEAVPAKTAVRSPAAVADLLRERARSLDTEVLWLLLLDAKNGLKGPPVEVTRGLLDASLVHPREVFREAIRTASASVILAHNHPSGDPTPSAEDIRVTRQLVKAGRIIAIPVMDHVIIGCPKGANGGGDANCVSMRESGAVAFDA